MSKQLVLIIDDNEAFRALVVNRLEKLGYGVIVAEDGATGVELFETHRPDGVLLDLFMPGMDGFAVLGKLVDRSVDTPVIAVSGTDSTKDVVRAVRGGGL